MSIQKKADLCERIFAGIERHESTCTRDNCPICHSVFMNQLSQEYKDLTKALPLSKDPECDEVLGTRLANKIRDEFSGLHFPRLSECPHIGKIIPLRNIGKKSISEYIEVMTKFGFTDKLY